MKQKVYSVVTETRDQLLECITIAADEIRHKRAKVQRTTQSVSLRAHACLQSGGALFENLI